MVKKIISILLLGAFVLTSCGGGSSGGTNNYPSYGAIDGYVYAAIGSAPSARITLDAQPGYAPLSGAGVTASSGSTSKSTTTNGNGYFKIDSLLVGSYNVSISKTGYTTVQRTVSVSANTTARVGGSSGTSVSPVSSGSIKVSANVAGGEVIIDSIETNVTVPASLYYTFGNISQGSHTVSITKSGFETVAPQEVNVTQGETTNVSFNMNPTGNTVPAAAAGEDSYWFVGNYYVYEGYGDDGHGLTNIYSQHQIYYELDGSGSSDPNGDSLSYQWTQISGPTVVFYDDTASKTTFIPEDGATYIFQLEVSDGYLTDIDNVSITSRILEGKLVIQANNGPSSDIFSIDLEDETGSGLKRLTTGEEYDGGPRWSPDGTKILFTTNPSGDEETYYIATMNEDGTGVNVLGVEGRSEDWAPDGMSLLIAQNEGGSSENLYRVNVDGTNKEQLTTLSKDIVLSYYSPDGDYIIAIHKRILEYNDAQ